MSISSAWSGITWLPRSLLTFCEFQLIFWLQLLNLSPAYGRNSAKQLKPRQSKAAKKAKAFYAFNKVPQLRQQTDKTRQNTHTHTVADVHMFDWKLNESRHEINFNWIRWHARRKKQRDIASHSQADWEKSSAICTTNESNESFTVCLSRWRATCATSRNRCHRLRVTVEQSEQSSIRDSVILCIYLRLI